MQLPVLLSDVHTPSSDVTYSAAIPVLESSRALFAPASQRAVHFAPALAQHSAN